MTAKRATDADVIATIAQQELEDLAKIDGGREGSGKVNFFALKKFFKCLRRSENPRQNISLDKENDLGITPSRDISQMMKK